ncbi:MAG: hypothetical protein JWP97_4730 [Labilithrix sp.]|nr:hypothetical protein [Labilithrix sp.]
MAEAADDAPLDYVLWGSAGHAKVLANLLAARGRRVVALFDNDPGATSSIAGVPLFVGRAGLERWRAGIDDVSRIRGVAAIGGHRGPDRLAVQALFEAQGVAVAEALVHPAAFVCPSASLGAGSQVLGMAVVASEARLGRACILNHKASADHESVLGDGVHLAPGSTLCGCVTLGDHVMIGAGAVVLPRVTIGAGTMVGAGSVVTRDLPAGVVAYGNPARIIRTL